MSRSSAKNNNSRERVNSPVSYYFSFSGERGVFISYKDGEEIEVQSMSIALLDTTESLRGWNDSEDTRVFSNQFRSSSDSITLRTKDNVLLSGNYKDNKENFKALGAKYSKNLYGLAVINGESVIVSVGLQGAALGAWVDYTSENKLYQIYDGLLTLEKGEQMKKGRVEYFVPKFTLSEIDEDLSIEAREADDTLLQPYLASVLAVNSDEPEEAAV